MRLDCRGAGAADTLGPETLAMTEWMPASRCFAAGDVAPAGGGGDAAAAAAAAAAAVASGNTGVTPVAGADPNAAAAAAAALAGKGADGTGMAVDPNAVGDPDGTPSGKSWVDALADDVRDYHEFKNFKSVDDLAKAYVNQSELIGKKGAIRPSDDAAQGLWDQYWTDLGRPADAAGYEADKVELPDGADAWFQPALRDAVMEKAHGLGLNTGQAQGMIAAYVELQHAQYVELKELRDGQLEQTGVELQRDWGTAFETNQQLANAAVKLGLEDRPGDWEKIQHLELKDGSFVWSHPTISRMMHRLGKLTNEERSIPQGAGGGFITTPAAAGVEIDKIYADAAKDRNHPYNHPHTREGKAAHDRMMALQTQLTPGAVRAN